MPSISPSKRFFLDQSQDWRAISRITVWSNSKLYYLSYISSKVDFYRTEMYPNSPYKIDLQSAMVR